MVQVSGIIPFLSVRDLLQASDGMAGSGRSLALIQDKLIHLHVFENKVFKGDVSQNIPFEHWKSLII